MLTTDTKPLLVHLSPAEKRRVKVMAASQDLTLRQAIRAAFDAWSAQIQSRARTPEQRGEPTTGAASQKPAQPRSAATPGEERRPANEESPPKPGGSPLPDVGEASRAWLRHAAQLDWSKCPAVESRTEGTRQNLGGSRDRRVAGSRPAEYRRRPPVAGNCGGLRTQPATARGPAAVLSRGCGACGPRQVTRRRVGMAPRLGNCLLLRNGRFTSKWRCQCGCRMLADLSLLIERTGWFAINSSLPQLTQCAVSVK